MVVPISGVDLMTVVLHLHLHVLYLLTLLPHSLHQSSKITHLCSPTLPQRASTAVATAHLRIDIWRERVNVARYDMLGEESIYLRGGL